MIKRKAIEEIWDQKGKNMDLNSENFWSTVICLYFSLVGFI